MTVDSIAAHHLEYNWTFKSMLLEPSQAVEAVKLLHEAVETNSAPIAGPRGAEDFDPNRYLDALPHLRLPDGYCLDYYYWKTASSGAPWIYAREVSRPPCSDLGERGKANGCFEPLELLMPDGSCDSWFELELFRRIAGQFRLSWHAAYFDFQFVTDPDTLERILTTHAYGMKPGFVDQAKRLETTVAVTKSGKGVTLEYLGFSKWKGFTRHLERISRRPPYDVLESKSAQHLAWHCGVRF